MHGARNGLLLILFFIFISNFLRSQQVSDILFDFKNEHQKLDQTLFELSQISKINFSFDQLLLNSINKDCRFYYKQKNIHFILEHLLKNTSLDYKIVQEFQYVIYKKSETIENYFVSGRIRDSTSGEFLIGTYIVDELSGDNTQSNEYGYFSLKTKNENVRLRFVYLGYQSKTINLILNGNKLIQVYLSSNNQLPEIVINQAYDNSENVNTSALKFNKSDILAKPSFFGEFDVMRNVLSSSGCSSGADGFGGLSVRGGSYDQNLVLFDDVPLYYSSHAIGLLSIFNVSAIRNVQFYKDRFPAKYGGRLSSILDIHTNEGNLFHWQVNAGVGLLSCNLNIEGPLWKDKLGMFLAIRRTSVDPFIRQITKYFKQQANKSGVTNYHYYDLNAKIQYNINTKNKFYLSFYNGADIYQDEDLQVIQTSEIRSSFKGFQNLQWSNQFIAGRFNRHWTKNIFMNAVCYYAKYESISENYNAYYSLTKEEVPDSSLNGRSNYVTIQDLGIKTAFDYYANKSHHLNFGVGVSRQFIGPAIYSYNHKSIDIPDVLHYSPSVNNEILNNNKQKTNLSYIYLEDEIKIWPKWNFNIGMRNSLITYSEKSNVAFEPRVHGSYQLSNRCNFSISFDRSQQILHLISSNSLGLPTDIWVASADKFKPQLANQLTVGLHLAPIKKMQINVYPYYKMLDNLIQLKEGANFAFEQKADIYRQLTQGTGKSQGVETEVNYKFHRVNLNINYTISKSTRQFPEINKGKEFDFKYDRPHQLKIQTGVNLGPRLNFTLAGEWDSGSPITLPTGKYEYLTIENGYPKVEVLDFQTINKARLPDIIRFDAQLQYTINEKWGKQEISFGVYNFTNHKNPIYIDLVADQTQINRDKFEQIILMPILPSLSYRISLIH